MSVINPDPDDHALREITDKTEITNFMTRTWGSPRMLVGMHVYNVTEIEATGLYDRAGKLLAFASWVIRDRTAFLCALHSLVAANGNAKLLLSALKPLVKARGARSIRAMATNDNMPALVFYQKNGFRLATLYVGAVDAYRPTMPGMITHGYEGIAIHDALELECLL